MTDGGLAAFSRGVLEHISAAIIASLLGSLAMLIGLAQTDKLEDIANWKVWLPLALGLAAFFWAAHSRWLARQRIRAASGAKITLLIAKLEGDAPTGGLRDTIAESVKRELGNSVAIFRWSDPLRIEDGTDEAAEARAQRTAHKWLAKKRCDLAIWGRVKADHVLSLRFTPAERSSAEPQTYVLTSDTLDLPTKFISDLGVAIAAYVASSVQGAIDSPLYMVPGLRTLAERLDAMTVRPNAMFDTATVGTLYHSYARVKLQLFDQIGDKRDLEASISLNRKALALRSHQTVKDDWATTQNNLGTSLARLAAITGDITYFDQAVVSLKAALQERTREKGLVRWAGTQLNLSGVLTSRGRLENSGANLEEAVRLQDSLICDELREADSSLWALAQSNRGVTLIALADREVGFESITRALDAFTSALEVRTFDLTPFEWAGTKSNLGTALIALGERTSSVGGYQDAILQFRDALKVMTRSRTPKLWAGLQNNLGIALTYVGQAQADEQMLSEAISTIRKALGEYTRSEVPALWAKAQHNLGRALMFSGELNEDSNSLNEAVAAFRASLTETTRVQAQRDRTSAMNDLGLTLLKLGDLTADPRYLVESRIIFDDLLAELTVAASPMNWVKAILNLGNVIRLLGELENDISLLGKAVDTLKRGLEVVSPTSHRGDWAAIHTNIAKAYLALGERGAGENYFALCCDECHEALSVLQDQPAAVLVTTIHQMLTRAEGSAKD
jgi:tetratricopeptide (TPR) repeat protein